MIRVEISCNRCGAMLGAATHNSGVEALGAAWTNALGKYADQAAHVLYCLRCVAYCNWLATPADKRGPAPADPCHRNDR